MSLEPRDSFLGNTAELTAKMEQAIRPSLAICSALPNAPGVSTALLKAWASLFIEAKVTPEQVERAFRRHMIESRWFPAPAEIIAQARKLRPPASVTYVAPLPPPEMSDEEREAMRIERMKIRDNMRMFAGEPELERSMTPLFDYLIWREIEEER